MEPARCPACHAVVASHADWCGLCFADLRPAEQPQPQQRQAEQSQAAAALMTETLTVDAPPAGASPVTLAAPAPPSPYVQPTPPATDAGESASGWPCLACGARVALELDACPECGGRFLAGSDESMSLHVPMVGDLAHVNPGMRYVVALVAAAVLCGGFLIVLLVLGKLF